MEFFLILLVIVVVVACERDRNYYGPPKRKPQPLVCTPIANKRVRRYLRTDSEFIAYYFDCHYQMRKERETVSAIPSRKADCFYEEYRTRMRTLPARRMLEKLLDYLDTHHPETKGGHDGSVRD